jgi:hypothetical protein
MQAHRSPLLQIGFRSRETLCSRFGPGEHFATGFDPGKGYVPGLSLGKQCAPGFGTGKQYVPGCSYLKLSLIYFLVCLFCDQ